MCLSSHTVVPSIKSYGNTQSGIRRFPGACCFIIQGVMKIPAVALSQVKELRKNSSGRPWEDVNTHWTRCVISRNEDVFPETHPATIRRCLGRWGLHLHSYQYLTSLCFPPFWISKSPHSHLFSVGGGRNWKRGKWFTEKAETNCENKRGAAHKQVKVKCHEWVTEQAWWKVFGVQSQEVTNVQGKRCRVSGPEREQEGQSDSVVPRMQKVSAVDALFGGAGSAAAPPPPPPPQLAGSPIVL